MKIGALILAAGSGTRFGSETPKQFLPVDETPMVLYSIDAIAPYVDAVALVVSEAEVDRAESILESAGLLRHVKLILGGETRSGSSLSGLRALITDGGLDYVIIHDAARCLLTGDVVKRTVEATVRYGAVITAIPAKDTVKIVSPAEDPRDSSKTKEDEASVVLSTTDRKRTYQVQTPQGFSASLLLDAYEKAERAGGLSLLTDDASAVETYTDHEVRIVLGSEENIKVTTPFDYMVAEAVAVARRLQANAEKRRTGEEQE